MDVKTIDSIDWEMVRPEISHDIFGKTLMDDGVKAVLTRVAPGGAFKNHRDKYGHLLYFLSGEASVSVEERHVIAHAGTIVRINPGEMHAYANTGKEDLILMSLNLPAK
jgi:quercetin dioxygenase-like cupin family protein